MGDFIEPSDLAPFATIASDKAEAMIEDAEATAVLAAPCIATEGFDNSAAVRAILRGAILRRNESGTGALSAQAAGPFSQTIDTRGEQRPWFWPSEIASLQSLCSDSKGGSYTVSMAGPEATPSGWPYSSAL